MNDQIDLIQLQRYLDGEIESTEVTFMNGRALTAGELENAMAAYRQEELDLEGAMLKEELKAIHENLNMDKAVQVLPVWVKWAAAMLLIATSGIFVWQYQNSEPQFDDYFGHFDQLVTFRDSDSSGYSQALELYTEKKYGEAYRALAQIDAPDSELKFYMALSALGSKDFEAAVEIFESLSDENYERYDQQISWYSGLAYWQAGKPEQAIRSLRKLSAGDDNYDRAQKLLKHLRD